MNITFRISLMNITFRVSLMNITFRVSVPLRWVPFSVFLCLSDEYNFCPFFGASLFLSRQWSVMFQDTPEYFNTVCLSRPSQVYRKEVQILRGFRWAARGTDVPAADTLSRDRELSRHQVSRQQTGCWRQTSGGRPQSDWRVSKVIFRKF